MRAAGSAQRGSPDVATGLHWRPAVDLGAVVKIGVVEYIKPQEARVVLTPAGARELVARGTPTPAGARELVAPGHDVSVETGAGAGSGYSDDAYAAAGALLADVRNVWQGSELLLKGKEPLPEEYASLSPGLVLFTYLHLAPAPELTSALIESGATCVAYETVETDDHRLPLLAPMSEFAGRLAPQMGAQAREKGRGVPCILLGGVAGVPPGKVAVLGGGIVGYNAAL